MPLVSTTVKSKTLIASFEVGDGVTIDGLKVGYVIEHSQGGTPVNSATAQIDVWGQLSAGAKAQVQAIFDAADSLLNT